MACSQESATSQFKGAVLLPRMPLGLAHISSSSTYEAVAAVCRTLGRLSVSDGALVPYFLRVITCRT